MGLTRSNRAETYVWVPSSACCHVLGAFGSNPWVNPWQPVPFLPFLIIQKTKCCLSQAGWAVPFSRRCFHMRGLFSSGQQTGSGVGGIWLCSSAILGDTGMCCRAVCACLPPSALWVGMQTHPQLALVGMQTQSHTDSTSLAAAKATESGWFLSVLTSLHLFFRACQTLTGSSCF